MANATSNFFDELGRRGHEPMLERVTGTVRFDLKAGKNIDRYFVAIKKGDIAVSNANEEADCVVHADRALFDGFATGESNAMTSFLRREITFEGDPELLVLFQRIFQGPQGAGVKSAAVGDERRRA